MEQLTKHPLTAFLISLLSQVNFDNQSMNSGTATLALSIKQKWYFY